MAVGDLVRTDLPVALTERAATSGMLAANVLLGQWQLQGHETWRRTEGVWGAGCYSDKPEDSGARRAMASRSPWG